MATSTKVAAHKHEDLERNLAEATKDLTALVKKCDLLEKRLAAAEKKLAAPQPAAAPAVEGLVTRGEWSKWKKKVARKIGLKL